MAPAGCGGCGNSHLIDFEFTTMRESEQSSPSLAHWGLSKSVSYVPASGGARRETLKDLHSQSTVSNGVSLAALMTVVAKAPRGITLGLHHGTNACIPGGNNVANEERA